MNYLRQSTATAVLIGPFLDDTDGKTPEDGLDVTTMDCDLYKHSNTHPLTKSDLVLTAAAGSNDCAVVANGMYSLELTASNTDTLGRTIVTVNIAGALPVWHEYTVLPASAFDALVLGTGYFSADVKAWLGTGVFADTAGYPKTTVKSGTGTGEVALASGQVTVSNNNDKTGYALSATGVDNIWDEPKAGHVTAATFGKYLDAEISSATSAAAVADAVWDEARADHVATDSFGAANQIVRAGTAQAGAAGTITLDAGASATNDLYADQTIYLLSGSGVGQSRKISSYVGATKIATVNRNWDVEPNATTVFVILPPAVLTGTGATAAEVWGYATRVLSSNATIADAVWDELRADHVGAGTFGQGSASVQGNVTGSIGSLGATAKTDVNTEVDTALTDIDLDHLAKTTYGATKPADGTLFDQIMNKDAGQTFDSTVASLEKLATAGTLTAAAVADAVWDEPKAGHTTAATYGKYLDAQVSAVAGAVGAGSISKTVTVTTGAGNPVEGVAVWVTTDEAGTNVIAGTLYTNTLGQVTFHLDTGDYWCWKQRSGYNFTNPQALAVS